MLCLRQKFADTNAMPPAAVSNKHAWPDHDAFIHVVAFDCLCIPVSDLPRSIGFYGELFAMRVVAGSAGASRVVLSRGGRVRLALYAHRNPASMPFTRIAAGVESVEAARDTVWELGIATVRERGDGQGDSFTIADPDGHEIRVRCLHRESGGLSGSEQVESARQAG